MTIDHLDPHVSWLAGIWQGEGSIVSSVGRNGKGNVQRSLKWTIVQKDPWLLYKTQEILTTYFNIPLGSISIYHKDNGKASVLEVAVFKYVDRIMTGIWPWLSVSRKEQAVSALIRYADASISHNYNKVECDSELTYEEPRDIFPLLLTKEG